MGGSNMKRIRERKSWIVLFAVLLLFAACKGETPTAPPTGGGTPPSGSPPPSGVNVVVAVSNSNPLVDSSVTITATVTDNGQPVPNGTAVEFVTNGGVLNDGGTSTVRTTTDGVATVTLTSATAGPIRVAVTVNNVTRTADVNFVARPITPTPPDSTPAITSIVPNIGRPSGGETIRITGRNFKGPVKVLFRVPGQINAVEAFVASATETTLEVITPSVNLGAGQQLQADIIVITQAGSVTEARTESTGAFTFRNEQLTPVVFSITPNSGPVTGGTRVTLIGEGFQEPVQVLFGTAEARVLNVKFGELLVETPAARDTPPTGSGTVTGAVDVTVRNLNSQTASTLTSGFNYKAAMQITAAGPTEGPFTGGTRVTIDGIGFVPPVAVTVGGVAVTPTFVSGTKIIVQTPAVAISACADRTAAIRVTNIVNGDSAEGPEFTYRAIKPVILSVSPTATRGGTIVVVVANAFGIPRLALGETNLQITNAVDNGDGTTTFTATVPTTLTLTTEACSAVPGASVVRDTPFNITYTSLTTGCTDTLQNGATIIPPPNTPIVTLVPASFTPFTATITPSTDPDGVGPLPPTSPTVAPSPSQQIFLTNTGTGTLTVTSVTPGAGCTNFTISSPTPPSDLQACDPFPITAIYQGTTTPGSEQCTVSVVTNAGNRTLTLSGTSR